MSPREWRFRLQDMLEAVAKIQGYLAGMSFGQFQADSRTVDAVIRNFTIIGEAASKLPDQTAQRHPEVPWRKMIGLRNYAVHEYWGLDLGTIWKTAQQDLPPLVPLLQAVLAKEDDTA
ncbi:MAG: DUF86 domain-containing protein [Thermodesulfobacteriota bacterium]